MSLRPLVLAVLAASLVAPAVAGLPPRRPITALAPVTTLPIGHHPDWVEITADAVWVGSSGPDAVHRIDPASNTVTARVELPGAPCAGLAAGFGSLWVPLCGPKPALARVDLATHALTAVLGYGTAAECGITTSPDSVWLVTVAGALVRVDPASGLIRQSVALPAGACNPLYSDGIVWVTNAAGAGVVAVDAARAMVLATVPTRPHPRFLAAGAGSVWTLNQGDGSLTRLDAHTRRVVQTIELGMAGRGGDVAYGAGRIWTTLSGVPLAMTDAATGTVLAEWSGAGGDSLRLGFGAVWLTNYEAGTVTRIPLEAVPAR